MVESVALIEEVHIYNYDDILDLPTNRPAPGQAPYVVEMVNDYSVTVMIPEEDIADGETFYFIVHVALTMEEGETDPDIIDLAGETAYGGGDDPDFPGRGAWFYVMAYTVRLVDEEPPGPDPEGSSETAWAYGGPFANELNDYVTQERWGWTNGPLLPGIYSFDIYAGAGQNILSNGTLVGTLLVVYDGTTAMVTYDIFPEFTLEEVHLYVGNDVLPMMNGDYTAAPGQLTIVEEEITVNSVTYSFTVSGPIYVAAHAVVYGEFDE